jgi:L-serine dehydratase
MAPSIFNDVIGPVMRGPSSSHTAASHRIGEIIRQVCDPLTGKVTVEFDRKGSLATTYEGQGSAMGLICGLIGVSILNPDMIRYKELAKEYGLDIEFLITAFKSDHPNTYKISIVRKSGETFRFIAISTGGGMIELNSINGFNVSIKGDYYENLLWFDSDPTVKTQEIIQDLKSHFPHSRLDLISNTSGGFLVNIKSRESITEHLDEIIGNRGGPMRKYQIYPVMPILAGFDKKMPFSTVKEMLSIADEKDLDLAELAVMYESSLAGITSQNVISLMSDISHHIKNSIVEGLKEKTYKDRVLGSQAHLLVKAAQENRIAGNGLNKVIAYVTAIMESKSSMEIIVACPTAGSAGVVGGAIYGVSEGYIEDEESIVKAFLAAGIIGVLIADKYTFAAEMGGCQVECGSASSMAAAALVQLMGGTARQAVNAASMALQNQIGIVCDPVADRVEVPCLGKNIAAAANAWCSANMSIAGYDPVIPLNEVIDTMKSVGESMPCSLRCTGLGGLAVTPASKRIFEELKKDKKEE